MIIDDAIYAMERRRRNLRILLFAIILVTLPFYFAGFFLWATAPDRGASLLDDGSPTATYTPLGRTATIQSTSVVAPSRTPFGGTATPQGDPLRPTPYQFNPPPAVPTSSIPTATFGVIIPTSTNAPTLTPQPQQPTNQPPPTNTTEPLPLPTEEPPPPVTEPPPPPTEEPPPPVTEEPPPPVTEPPPPPDDGGGGEDTTEQIVAQDGDGGDTTSEGGE